MRAIILLMFFFSFSASAYKLNPTQPDALDYSHSNPVPDYSSCAVETVQCTWDSVPSYNEPFFLFSVCGDETYYEAFGIHSAPVSGCQDSDGVAIDCYHCTCPSGQIRDRGVCVIDQQCEQGIQNYSTGACYPQSCPYGDGSDIDCQRVASCPLSEGTTLFQDPLRCECTNGQVWNPFYETCENPTCDGELGSPVDSFFNTQTQQCECPSTHHLNSQTNQCIQHICDTPDEIYVSTREQCELASDCTGNQDLITSTNTCQNPTPSSQSCSNIYNGLAFAIANIPSYECYLPYPQYDESDNPILPEGCLFIADASWIGVQYDEMVSACNQCIQDGDTPVLVPGTQFQGDAQQWIFSQNSCKDKQNLCALRSGTWNAYLNLCLDPQLEISEVPAPPVYSSSSAQSSSVSSSIASSQQASAGTGSGSSSGTGGSGGTGGDGGEGEGGSGGTGTGSASSVASIANSSVENSIANSSAENSSAASAFSASSNSGTASSDDSSSLSGGGGSASSSGNPSSSGGAGASEAGTGGGGGGGGGSAGASFPSSANNSSSNNSTWAIPDKGTFNPDASEQALEDAQADYAQAVQNIKDEIQAQFANDLVGQGTLSDFCIVIYTKDVCFGLAKWTDHLHPIGAAIFFAAAFLSFVIVMRR